jgi:NADH dehydrogenase
MILITDATSFVGRAIANHLGAAGYQVRCLLQPSPNRQLLPPGRAFSTVAASMDDLPAMRTAMQDVSAVVHLTWEEDLDTGRHLDEHPQETRNLIQAMREADVHRMVYLSRLGADRASAYPLFRIRGEAEAAVKESELDYTILQPALTYGPGDAFTELLVMLAKSTPLVLPFPDPGLSRFQPLWIGDLTTCVAMALAEKPHLGQTIPLGGPEHFTFEQLVAEVLTAAGVRRRLVRVRIPFVRGASRVFDVLLPRNPTPLWWLDILAHGSTTELGTVARHYDFEPSRLIHCLDYLRQPRHWRRDLIRFTLDMR